MVFKLFSAFYVEVVRNVPLLLQLFFWYFAVLRALPSRREQIEILEGIAGINITGLYLPAPVAEDGAGVVVIALLLFLILALAIGDGQKSASMKPEKLFQFFIRLLFNYCWDSDFFLCDGATNRLVLSFV